MKPLKQTKFIAIAVGYAKPIIIGCRGLNRPGNPIGAGHDPV